MFCGLAREFWGLPASNGVLSFYGVSALLGSLTGVIMALLSEDEGGTVVYYKSLYPIYPARVPVQDTCSDELCYAKLGEIISNYPFLEDSARGRTAAEQASFQAIALLVCALAAFLGGGCTGLLVRLSATRCGNACPPGVWMDGSFMLNKYADKRSRYERQGSHSSEEQSAFI